MKINSKDRSSYSEIKYGALMSYITIFFNIGIGLVYTPWMIKEIGQSEYALYSLAITLISFFAIDFGLGEAVARFLAKYTIEKKEKEKEEFLGIIFKVYLLIDIILIFILGTTYIFADVIYAKLTVNELLKFKVVFIMAAAYSIFSFPFMPLDGILIANEKFSIQKIADLLYKLISTSTMIIVLILGYKLYALVIINIIAGIFKIAFKVRFILKNKLLKFNIKAKDKYLLKEIFKFSMWTAIIAIAQRFILNITPTVLAAFSGSIEISIFSVAMVIEGYTWTFANALNGLFLPKVTRITLNTNDTSELENLMIKIGRIQLILVGLLILGFIVMGKEFIILWMGSSFSNAYYVAILLIAPCIITLTQQIANTALVATNEIKYRAISSITVAIISLTISIILSSRWGAIGSAIGIFLGNIIGQVVFLNIVYRRVLNINIKRFFRECHLKMLIPMIITMIFSVFIHTILPTNNLGMFIVKVAIICIVYLIIIWYKVLDENEKSLSNNIIKKLVRR